MKSIYLLAFILIIIACQENEKYSEKLSPSYNYNLVSDNNVISFSLDSTTANVSPFLTYYHDKRDERQLLVSFNSFLNELQFYDFAEKKLIFKIPIDMNGTKGIGPLIACTVHSLDSIYVFPSQDESFYRLDDKNQIFEKINYQSLEGYTNLRPSAQFFSSIPFLKNDKLYAKVLFQTNFRTVTNSQLSKVHLGYEIDLITGQINPMEHFYPDYFKDGMKHFDFSASYTDEKFVYSFFGEHSLYSSPSPNIELAQYDAKSRYLKNEIPLFPAGGDRLARGQYMSTSDHYGNIIYDSYREVYYRFCYPAIELKQLQEIVDNIQNPRRFSIQIFDENLNIIGETLFENNVKYLPKNVFVGKEGLYMSINHSGNEKVKEDAFSFELLKLISID